MSCLEEVLQLNKNIFANMFSFSLLDENMFKLDLSVDNEELYKTDLSSTAKLSKYIHNKIIASNSTLAIGGYMEDRLIYRKSEHFGVGEEARTIHLGVDVWCEANTELFAFMDSKIHSFNDNNTFGDYGPTIILEHCLENTIFYTLYGHLSTKSIQNITVGGKIKKGEKFAELGNEIENGNWPPHLHFQVIKDMQGRKGDYPGVAGNKEKAQFAELCPNPYLILKI